MNFFRKRKLTESEELYIDLVKAIVAREDAIIEINPSNMSYLVSLEKEDYHLSLDENGLEISNHTFLISRHLGQDVIDIAKDIVKVETTRRRENRREEIFKNETNLLNNIINNISNV